MVGLGIYQKLSQAIEHKEKARDIGRSDGKPSSLADIRRANANGLR